MPKATTGLNLKISRASAFVVVVGVYAFAYGLVLLQTLSDNTLLITIFLLVVGPLIVLTVIAFQIMDWLTQLAVYLKPTR